MSPHDNDVRFEVSVAAPLEHAFAVFTQRCDDWWPRPYRLGAGERVDTVIEPRAGGRWYERTADGEENNWGEVLAWDPPHHVALSWQITPQFTPEPDEQRTSRIDVEFTPEGSDRTTVSLVHSEIPRHGEGWEGLRAALADDGAWPGIMRAYAELTASSRVGAS
jgi:uncharacterized protein YndB with AHSA1/START domain